MEKIVEKHNKMARTKIGWKQQSSHKEKTHTNYIKCSHLQRGLFVHRQEEEAGRKTQQGADIDRLFETTTP